MYYTNWYNTLYNFLHMNIFDFLMLKLYIFLSKSILVVLILLMFYSKKKMFFEDKVSFKFRIGN